MGRRQLRWSRVHAAIAGQRSPRTRGRSRFAHLQRVAGNRAVSAMIQRHPQGTSFEDVGLRQTPAGTGRSRSSATTPGVGSGGAVTPGGSTTTAAPAGPDYDDLARRLQQAIEGWGTDEEEVYSVLGTVGRDPTKLHALRTAYRDRTGRTLDGDIRGDMGGVELAVANALIGGTREQRIRRQLQRTPWGGWAAAMIDVLSIPVDWEYTGTGSFHRGGSIFLNYRKPSKPAALTMVHEVQHAVSYRSGQRKPATSTPKAEWVTSMIADEAEAVTKSMEAALGMRAQGETATSLGQNASMLNQFKADFDAERARRVEAGASALSAYLGARRHVRDGLVAGWFSDGTFRTSTSGAAALTYQQHYENEWDRLNNVGGS